MKKLLLILCALATFSLGCTVSKVSTTPKTAVEMALLSQSSDEALDQLEVPDLSAYTLFAFDTTEFEGFKDDANKYEISALRRHLLRNGMSYTEEKDDADVIVYPLDAVSAIDESEILIGIPQLPVTLPGAGSITTPELALYKRHSQKGRSKYAAYAVDNENRRLAFDLGEGAHESWYVRWKILFVISFATTDLGPPIRKAKNPKEAASSK